MKESKPAGQKPVKPQQPANRPQSTLRSLLNGLELTNGKSEVKLENRSFRLDSVIRFDHLIGREFKLETLLKALNKIVDFKGTSKVAELFSRLILKSVIDRLVREMVKVAERGGQLTEKEMEALVRELNRHLANIGRELQQGNKPTDKLKKTPAQEPAKSELIKTELVYDKETKALRLEVKGIATEKELNEALQELAKPGILPFLGAVIPVLKEMKSAAETVTNFSGETKVEAAAHAELVKYVAQVVTGTPGSEPVLTRAISSLLTGSDSPVAKELVGELLQQMTPAVALPTLLKAHAQAQTAGNTTAAQKVEQAIVDYARTSVGQKAIVTAFANNTEQALVSSEIGQKALVQAVKQMIAAPVTAEAKPMITAAKPTTVEKAVVNIREIAQANLARLAPATLTVDNAKALVSLAVKIETSLEKVSKSEGKASAIAAQKAKAARQRVAPINQRSGVVNAMARRAVNRNPVIQARIATAQAAVKDVMRAADAGSFVLPKSVIEHLYAGLAGVNLVPAAGKAVAGGNFSYPAESRSASSLRHVVQALEAQAARAVTSKDPVAWAKVFTLSAQVMLYGIIMRLVGGKLSRVDQVIELLKQKKELAKIVAKIKKGNLDEATDELVDAVLATTSYSELIAA